MPFSKYLVEDPGLAALFEMIQPWWPLKPKRKSSESLDSTIEGDEMPERKGELLASSSTSLESAENASDVDLLVDATDKLDDDLLRQALQEWHPNRTSNPSMSSSPALTSGLTDDFSRLTVGDTGGARPAPESGEVIEISDSPPKPKMKKMVLDNSEQRQRLQRLQLLQCSGCSYKHVILTCHKQFCKCFHTTVQ